ncbi:hypothetical protein [Syntrophobotulus glycolicus]|uniref:hypothetical protein n=1 Tax=Syntrophobotulus glycolicus TaxID=51197 RepID=UPI00059BE395|nr:hypothetical protein [Syntrophobotulus glycolicus]
MREANTPLTFAFYLAQRLKEIPFSPVSHLFFPVIRFWYPNSIYSLIFFDLAVAVLIRFSSLYSSSCNHLIPGLNQAYPDYGTLCRIYANQAFPNQSSLRQAFLKQPPSRQTAAASSSSVEPKPDPYTITSIFNPPPTIEADVPPNPRNFSLILSISAPYPTAEHAGITFSLILFEQVNVPAFTIPLLSLLYYFLANFL